MRQNNFDFLRFFFALVVAARHINVLAGINIFDFIAPLPSIAVFFCISGFLTPASYIKSASIKEFYKKRARRILPPYLLVVFSCAIFLSVISEYSLREYFINPHFFKYLFANLTFLNFLEPSLPGVFNGDTFFNSAVNGSLWTLKVEVGFYIVLPILLYFAFKIKRKYLLLLIIYVLSILYRYILIDLSAQPGLEMLRPFAHQLPGFMSFFACGIAFYFYFDFFVKHKNWFFWIGFVLFVLEKIVGWGLIFTPFALASMVFAFAYSFKGKKLNNFGKYGDPSYGIFLYHYPIIQLAIYFGFFEHYNNYLVSGAILLLVIVLGFLSFHSYEKKFSKR